MFWRSRVVPAFVLTLIAWAYVDRPAAVHAQELPACADAGLATLVGRVQDRHTQVPLAGATVTASWRAEEERVARVTADSAGRVWLCAPAGSTVTLRAAYHQVRGSSRSAALVAGRVNRQLVELEAPTSYVRGVVTDELTGTPVQYAQVSLANTPLATLTNAEGRFRFERVPVGDYVMRIAHVAYKLVPAPLQVRSDDLDAAVRLAPAAIALDAVVVTAFSRKLDTVGFYERERRGHGTFISRRQIDAMRAQTAADLLRNLPGVRLTPHQGQRNAAREDVSGRGRCRYSYIIDGARTLPDFDLTLMAPYAIEGIEVYRGMAEVPISFRGHVSREGPASCGVIAIWTRDGH